MGKSPEQAMASMIEGLEKRTGKSLKHWLGLAKGLRKHGEIVKHLKQHGLTHGYANLVAHKALASDSVSAAGQGVDLVAEQYRGAKAALRPIYDVLTARVRKLGSDVELSPKKTYVSLRRTKQFGLIQPSTATRVDLGINLKGVPPKGRLEAAGSLGGMVTHRVRVESVGDVDAQLIGWLKLAYEKA